MKIRSSKDSFVAVNVRHGHLIVFSTCFFFQTDKFKVEVPFTTDGRSQAESLIDQYLKKITYTVEMTFPFVKNRLLVSHKQEVLWSGTLQERILLLIQSSDLISNDHFTKTILTPIENAQWILIRQIQRLEVVTHFIINLFFFQNCCKRWSNLRFIESLTLHFTSLFKEAIQLNPVHKPTLQLLLQGSIVPSIHNKKLFWWLLLVVFDFDSFLCV
jgi:hypothetical protein